LVLELVSGQPPQQAFSLEDWEAALEVDEVRAVAAEEIPVVFPAVVGRVAVAVPAETGK